MNFNAKDIVNVIIAGTAGQGVITLKRLIEFAAQKAGILSGAVSWGYNSLEKLRAMEPDAVFLTLDEVLEN